MPSQRKNAVPEAKKPERAEEVWNLKLYVAGQTPKSITAFANLKRICEEKLAGKYSIEVIDSWKTLNWPRETRSWRSRPWSGSFPYR